MYTICHPVPQDIDDVFSFMNQCDIAEYGEPDSSREDLEQEWEELDIAQDIWICRDETGNICGYAAVAKEDARIVQDVYIDPKTTHEGVEDDLMGFCGQRVYELTGSGVATEPVDLAGYVTAVNSRLQAAYERAGFSRHTWHYRMRIDFSEPLAVPVWPEGYTLAAYQPKDEQELYELIQAAFDWPGHVRHPIEFWRNLVFRGGRYDPQYFVLVRHQGKLVAAALCYDEDDRGWIRQLALDKDYQGRGLGGRLLRHMFSVFSCNGKNSVGLGVASVNDKAWQFYERNGMYRDREYIEYRMPITQSVT